MAKCQKVFLFLNAMRIYRIVTRYMLKEEHSNMSAPSSIFCIFAQLGRFRKTLTECRTKEDYAFYWFLNGCRVQRGADLPGYGAF